MIDREPVVPADADRPARSRPGEITPPPGDPGLEELSNSVSRGLLPQMSVTAATRLTSRPLSSDSTPGDPVRAWLARLPADLPPFAPVAGTASEARSPAEAHAVSRALGCPDLFIVDSPDQITGERVIAQLAKGVGGRVLVLSPDPGAADRIAERLADAGVVRALADHENPTRPSPVVARLTSRALGIDRAARLRREAADALTAAEGRLAEGESLTAISDAIVELTSLRDRAEIEVRAVHDGAAIGRMEADLAALRRRAAESHAPQEARRAGFFAWLLGRRHPPEPAELEKEAGVLAAEVAARAAARDEAIRADLSIRRAPLDARLAELIAKRDRIDRAQQEVALARRRVEELAGSDLVRQLLTEPRIIVGTPGSLESDPVLVGSPPFAILVLDRCEELTESDFLRLHGLASRWILVGEAQAREDSSSSSSHWRPELDGKPGRNGRHHEMPFASRLAHLLDRDPWASEPGRLVCRLLHPVTSTGRQFLMREPLLDRPEIELRFAADGDGEPAVAEVAFPAGTTFADAKAFLFHQLGEVLLHTCAESSWDQSSGSIVIRWPAAENPTCESVWIDLEPGVRERVVSSTSSAFTAAVEFDPSFGWDRAGAEAWIAKHQRPESAGRFARIPMPTAPMH